MKSNVAIETLDLFGHIDQAVAVLVVDGSVDYEGALQVFLNNDALAAFLKKKRADEPTKLFQYVEDRLGIALNFVIWNDLQGMALHSAPDTQFDISRADLEPMVDVADSYATMHKVNQGRMSMAEAIDKMKNKEVFCFGESQKQKLIETDKAAFCFAQLRLDSAEASTDQKVFLLEQSAERYKINRGINAPINKLKISELAVQNGCSCSITIEPESTFCIAFSPTTLATLKE